MEETPEARVHALYEAIQAQDEARVRALIHPEAKVEMMMANGAMVEGREAVLATIRQAWGIVFRLTAHEIERLDANTFLVTGRIRVPTETEGFADRPAVWITDWAEEMIIGQRLFANIDAARADYAARRPCG